MAGLSLPTPLPTLLCRYVGEHISSSLTLPLRKRAGWGLAPKLCQYLRPKIHPLLLDGAINSQHTICLNIYQVATSLDWGTAFPGFSADH